MAATGSKATYTGASVTAGGWLLSSEAGVFIGILIGIAGLALNYYFKRREDQRMQEEHDIRVRMMLTPPAVSVGAPSAAVIATSVTGA